MSKHFDEELLRLNPSAELQNGSFVLYRSEVAIVSNISSEKQHIKIQLHTETGKKISVRPKDIYLLSSNIGPDGQLSQVTKLLSINYLEEGWALLWEMGDSCSLLDLAEAVFSGTGPQELYNAFCLINETPYFKGKPNQIMVRSPEQVCEEQEKLQRKKEEAERWQHFYRHYQESKYSTEDQPFIQEIEAIAYGEKQSCRLFREIKLEATMENAHEWLLRQKLWNERLNPYPRRNQLEERPLALEQLLGEAECRAWRKFLQRFCEAARQLPCSSEESSSAAQQAELGDEQLENLEQLLQDFCTQQDLSYFAADTSQEQGEGQTNSSELQCLPVSKTLAASSHNSLWQMPKRCNLTRLRAWAIDDPWSQDPDDAISIEKGAGGTNDISLWIHIADPASLIPFDSPLAAEALKRGATVYLPEGSSAMLPKELVQVLGLGLQNISMALSVRVRLQPSSANTINDFEAEGDTAAATLEVLDLCRSWVHVQRLSYDQVDQILTGENSSHPLQEAWLLCQSHLKARQANHALQFNMYNTKVVVGERITIENLPNTTSRNLVAEAMLMAGAAMAQFAHQQGLAIPFLSQSAPKGPLPTTLETMADMFQVRKLMSPSTVRCEALPHSSIGLPMYTRGTSPLRRYLDLLTHQQLHSFLLQREGLGLGYLNKDELISCTAQAEIQVSRVNNAQRASQQHWQMLYLKQEGKQRLYQAVVLELRYSGKHQNLGCKALCSLPEIGIESMVSSKTPLKLNQKIQVCLKGVQLVTREAHFQVVA